MACLPVVVDFVSPYGEGMTHLLKPPTPIAAASLDVARRWLSPELVNHSVRSWAWASLLARAEGRTFDDELLFVAAMLHDAGVARHFDAHEVAFEEAGGAVAAVFGAGAGWSPARSERVREIIERHMWRSVDPALDVEGYLLELATTLDVRGDGASRWQEADLRSITARVPLLDFGRAFDASIAAQAARKPETAAVRPHASGGVAAGTAFWDALAATGS